ncbi:MAG: hypothetical protein D6791_04460, partial [Chloroflexi bacterium]
VVAGSPATNVVVTDQLGPDVTLVPNSFTGSPPPEVSPDGRTLTWRLPRLGLETRKWSYRVTMTQTPGVYPTNSFAGAEYIDSTGQPATLIFPQPQVEVLAPAAKNPQLMCRDHDHDSGTTPSNTMGESWWNSPDIWLRHQQDGSAFHENPVSGQTNYVYVRVRNIGDAVLENIVVHVYAAPIALNLSWPASWTPQIGSQTIPSLAPGAMAQVSIPWVAPTQAGRYGFLTRIETANDPIHVEGYPAFDNNICQKNVDLVESTSTGSGVGIGNVGMGPVNGTISINSPTFPANGTGKVTFNDPGLFRRWQDNGGFVRGGQVLPDQNAVSFQGNGSGQVSLDIHRLPFQSEESSSLSVQFENPGTGPSRVSLNVQQSLDGQIVGGAVVRAASALTYLPIVLH